MNTCSGHAHRTALQFPLVGSDGTLAEETLPTQDVQTSEPLMVAGPMFVSALETVAASRKTQFGSWRTEPVAAALIRL